MNPARCSCYYGLTAGLVALLVLAGSLVQVPTRSGRPMPLVARASAVSNQATIYSPDSPLANAILPAGSQLPDPFFKQVSPTGPVSAFEKGLAALAPGGSRPFASWTHPAFRTPGVSLPRYALLHVYRC